MQLVIFETLKKIIYLNRKLPAELTLTLSDSTLKNDTVLTVSVVEKLNRQRPWDEKFEVDYLFVQDEDYNKPEIIEKLLNKEHDIAYIKIPKR